MRRTFLRLLALAGILLVPATVSAEIPLHSSFQLHDFDAAILSSLTYDDATIVYLAELGAITSQQRAARREYEEIGCYPYGIMRDGKQMESGYNCQTFFCVGYDRGPKVCKDKAGKAFGGVVEINHRLAIVDVKKKDVPFSSFPEEDQTEEMKTKIAQLKPYKCSPFYLMLFDVAAGEGFTCEEVGKYPYFSNANRCVTDWTVSATAQTCSTKWREDELTYREQSLRYREGGFSSASSSASSSGATMGSSSSAAPIVVSFPDVIEGHYGYTAIINLASRGIVRGYDDGAFRPYNTVNRAEFAKVLIGGLHPGQLKKERECFSDVRRQWFSEAICAAKRLQWLAGYADGTFRPQQTIKKSEAMKIVVMALGVPLDSNAALPPGTPDGQWYSPYVRKAMELGLILEPSFNPGADVTRADTAVWIYRSLKTRGQ